MPRLQPTLRLAAALIAVVVAMSRPALAEQAPGDATQRFAAVFRAINPQLQVHQSLAFARSVLADAERNKLDPELLAALVTVESGWRPNAVSRTGARGLGQLMPATARTLGVDPFDPAQNLHGAAQYLRLMLDRFADRGQSALRLALGAYNAGPKAVERYHGIPPYGETQSYVTKVLRTWHLLDHRIGVAAPVAPDERTWLVEAGASALAVSPAATR